MFQFSWKSHDLTSIVRRIKINGSRYTGKRIVNKERVSKYYNGQLSGVTRPQNNVQVGVYINKSNQFQHLRVIIEDNGRRYVDINQRIYKTRTIIFMA